jgi:hypothetical protein
LLERGQTALSVPSKLQPSAVVHVFLCTYEWLPRENIRQFSFQASTDLRSRSFHRRSPNPHAMDTGCTAAEYQAYPGLLLLLKSDFQYGF